MSGWGDEESGGGWGSAPPSDMQRESYQRGGGAMADDGYLALCDRVPRDLRKLQTAIGGIQTAIKNMGTRRDTQKARDRLKRDLDTGTSVTKSLTKLLQSGFRKYLSDVSPAEKAKRRKQRDKFLQDLTKLARTFQEVMNEAMEQEQKHVIRARASIGRAGDDSRDSEYNQALLQHQQIEYDLDFDDALVQEREGAIQHIQRDIQEVNEAFKDLARLEEQQGQDLDNMEWHIQEAHQRTERGVKHLVTATKHQNKYRKSIVCFFSILVVAAVGVGLYLYLRSRH